MIVLGVPDLGAQIPVSIGHGHERLSGGTMLRYSGPAIDIAEDGQLTERGGSGSNNLGIHVVVPLGLKVGSFDLVAIVSC